MGLYDREIQKQKRERAEKVSKAKERQDMAKMEKMPDKNSISQENTKAIFGELVGNPGNELMNMPQIAKIVNSAKGT